MATGKSGSSTEGSAKARRRICENRRARHEYEVLETIEVGLVLQGSEVKSLRAGKGSIAEAFVRFEGEEAWLVDAHIATYDQANRNNHEPRRRRKLLMHSREIFRWTRRVRERGLTVVPLRLYFLGAWVKLEVGLARGRKVHDKRAALKEKEDAREMARAVRQRR